MNALEVKDLCVRYEEVEALRGVSLSVAQGELVGIVGPNGGGKSTLLKAVLGLCPASSGTVSVFGKPYDPHTRLVGYVPQYGTMERSFPITVTEVAESGADGGGLHLFHHHPTADIARRMMELVGISDLGDRLVGELSGGQFQRLLIARCLAIQPKMLLLDEPTASIDPESREHVYRVLEGLHREGMTIVLVTHDVEGIQGKVDHIVRLDGRVLDD
ncbi:MAG: ABC transporter ATP-binding protein [Sphaerochaeta sp.]|jgi:zinc transport system ATP-binding protein|nr:ABC transporter ATP-binding protein [Sphaerochaeta sp.]